jgi:hypothetical protein
MIEDEPWEVSIGRNLAAALLLAYRGHNGESIDHLNAAIRRADHLYSARCFGLFNGLAGLGWVVEHLYRRMSKRAEVSPLNADVDAALLQELHRGRWEGSWDLANGLSGIGVYFLARLPGSNAKQGLDLVVGHLAEVTSRRQFLSDSRVDMSFFHGVSGLGYFLEELALGAITVAPAGWMLRQVAELSERTGGVTIPSGASESHLWHWMSRREADSKLVNATLRRIEEILENSNTEQDTAMGLELLVAVNVFDSDWPARAEDIGSLSRK